MGKGHRDNHAARVKRGSVAFKKKQERRKESSKPKCGVCGNPARRKTMTAGICQNCVARQKLSTPYAKPEE